MTFINIQTGYSFLSSTLLSEHLKQYQNGHPTTALGIVNVNAFFDLRELHQQLSSATTKIVSGMTLRTKDNDVISDWVVYPKNEQGMTILKELTTQVSHNRHKDYPSSVVLPQSNHLLYIMPSLHGYIGTQIGLDNQERIREELIRLKQLYSAFYIGINLPATAADEEWNRCLRSLADQYGIPCIAFPRIRTLTRDENRILDVLSAIREGVTVDHLKIHEDHNESLIDMQMSYFSPSEWQQATSFIQRVDWQPSKHKKLPMPFQVAQADVDINMYLKALAQRGLQRRFTTQSIPLVYRERLQHELDVIVSLGYADYFLVVYDYVKYAKTHGILVGPGRGSGAASLVCYTLGITDVDPIKYGLLFERFLNPERVSMPDIDVDFQDDRRQDVIAYLRDKYTNEHFAHVIAFTRFQAKSALRDVAKAIGLSLLDADRLAKAVPATATLKETYQSNVGFRALIDSHPLFSDVYNIASRIEELPRQTTLHAAGVVISKDRLASLTPVYEQEPHVWTTQYDMTYIEDEGLLKMDVLGLKNLTIIQNTLASINAGRTTPLTLNDISFDDPRVYELIRSGRTSGIFQLESGGIINEAIKVVLPENFEDIVSILALFRPGPKDYIPTYAARKHGKEAYRIEPSILEPILKPTYGIIVYQEQIMQIVQVMAGFTIGKADIIRRAISKKKESEMLKIREEFLAGSQTKGHQRAEAEQVFELILKFADYGFARAHAVAYAVVSVQMAFLKVHYPSHFYAAVLNSFALGSNDTKLQDYLNEIRRLGLRVAHPSIRTSGKEFVAYQDGVIHYALGAINGIGAVLVDAILAERNVRPYQDFLDVVVRLPQKLRQEKAILALIDAGTFDEFAMNRASLRFNVQTALNYASILHQSGQLTPLDPPRLQLIKGDKMEDLEREYRVLGTFLSGFPLQERRHELTQMGYITIQQMEQFINRPVRIMAYINDVRTIKTKKGEAMALVTVYDETDSWTIPVFPKLYQTLHTSLMKGEFATFEGRVEQTEQRLGLMLFNIKIESRERYV